MTDTAAEARKRKILARAEQRMASITFDGTPSADQSATQEPVSKFANNDSTTPSESASDNTTVAVSGAACNSHAHRAHILHGSPWLSFIFCKRARTHRKAFMIQL